jgi:hypothetical protein
MSWLKVNMIHKVLLSTNNNSSAESLLQRNEAKRAGIGAV